MLLSVTYKTFVMGVVVLNVIMLNVIMLSVVATDFNVPNDDLPLDLLKLSHIFTCNHCKMIIRSFLDAYFLVMCDPSMTKL